MKKLWVLSIRTSLPDKCYMPRDLKLTFSAFETFAEARKAMREVMKDCAFSKNDMFDGKGKIIALDEYIDGMKVYKEVYDGELTKELLIKIYDALLSIIKGENTVLELDKGKYDDDRIAFIYDGESLTSKGIGTAIDDCYDPYIATNAFSMEEEKDYYVYIDDMFGQDCSSELYIDLKQVEVK